ncbi:GAF domain-containing protein [Sporobolomyces salmoneus]|uniref:GAF domain-containing protein n=1 Tax=Sporobolomyces salmoneus TaxID=183962 RepID=UPI003173B21D
MAGLDYGHAQQIRPPSPTATASSRGGDEADPLSVPFHFGATPSLRLDVSQPTAQNVTFPLAKPPLERQQSNLSTTSSLSSSTPAAPPPPPKPFSLPPGLANSPLHSTIDVRTNSRDQMRQARGARISNEPPIPLEIQQLLLTTPPPPRRQYKSAVSFPPPSLPARNFVEYKPEEEKPTSLLKRIRALTLRNGPSKEEEIVVVRPRAVAPKKEVLDLKRSARLRERTPEDILAFYDPQTWKEYGSLYAAGRLDVESPPRPPNDNSAPASQTFPSMRSKASAPPSFEAMTPYDLAHFPAPLNLSPLSPIRERLISNLDLLGTFLPNENTLLSPQFSPNFPAQQWTSPTSPSFSPTSSPGSRQDSHFQAMSSPDARSRTRGWSSASTTPSTIMSTSKTSHYGTTATSVPYFKSIQAFPALQSILDRLVISLETISVATITLFPTSPASTRLDILASSGDASTWPEIAVDFALDAHTILNGSKGLVVNDVEKDWRWRGNRDLEEKGVKFYAGMPFFAPSSLSLRTADVSFSVAQFEEEAGGARIAIGVVSLIDDRPREKGAFGTAERAKLRSIASEITSEIERFVLQRAGAIDSLSSRRTSATSAATFQSGSVPTPALPSARTDGPTRSPSSSQRARNGKGHVKKVSFDANALPSPSPALPPPPPPRVASPTFAEPDSIPALFQSHSPQKLLDLACSSLARQLDLALVYLVELSALPPRSAVFGPSLPSLSLIASHGLPPSAQNDNSANFDPTLHYKALRAPEKGLLYRSASSAEPFDSGILLPVIENDASRKGWVIAGYAEQRGRRWGEDEMAVFENVTRGIEKILLWREEWK